MRTTRWRAALLLAAMAGPVLAGAGEVWRCGNSYGQAPCPGGTRVEGITDTAAKDEGAFTSASARRDAALADRLEKARLAREARAPQVVIPPQPRPEAAAPPKKAAGKPEGKRGKAGKGSAKADEPFTAVAPAR